MEKGLQGERSGRAQSAPPRRSDARPEVDRLRAAGSDAERQAGLPRALRPGARQRQEPSATATEHARLLHIRPRSAARRRGGGHPAGGKSLAAGGGGVPGRAAMNPGGGGAAPAFPGPVQCKCRRAPLAMRAPGPARRKPTGAWVRAGPET